MTRIHAIGLSLTKSGSMWLYSVQRDYLPVGRNGKSGLFLSVCRSAVHSPAGGKNKPAAPFVYLDHAGKAIKDGRMILHLSSAIWVQNKTHRVSQICEDRGTRGGCAIPNPCIAPQSANAVVILVAASVGASRDRLHGPGFALHDYTAARIGGPVQRTCFPTSDVSLFARSPATGLPDSVNPETKSCTFSESHALQGISRLLVLIVYRHGCSQQHMIQRLDRVIYNVKHTMKTEKCQYML